LPIEIYQWLRLPLGSGRSKSFVRTDGIDQCRTGIDRYCDTKRLAEFFFSGAELLCSCRMHGDTTVAAQGDRYSECYQLACLAVEMTCFCASPAEGRITSHRIRAKFTDLADAGDDLIAVIVPIVHCHGNLYYGFNGHYLDPFAALEDGRTTQFDIRADQGSGECRNRQQLNY
jgi:hypothetical protein